MTTSDADLSSYAAVRVAEHKYYWIFVYPELALLLSGWKYTFLKRTVRWLTNIRLPQAAMSISRASHIYRESAQWGCSPSRHKNKQCMWGTEPPSETKRTMQVHRINLSTYIHFTVDNSRSKDLTIPKFPFKLIYKPKQQSFKNISFFFLPIKCHSLVLKVRLCPELWIQQGLFCDYTGMTAWVWHFNIEMWNFNLNLYSVASQ